jgi:malonyl CoA-acyl carrier protein transacylase
MTATVVMTAPARCAVQVAIQAPRVPVYSNVTAQPFPPAPAAMRALLGRQLCEPVKWEATLKGLVAAGGGHTAAASSATAKCCCCVHSTMTECCTRAAVHHFR